MKVGEQIRIRIGRLKLMKVRYVREHGEKGTSRKISSGTERGGGKPRQVMKKKIERKQSKFKILKVYTPSGCKGIGNRELYFLLCSDLSKVRRLEYYSKILFKVFSYKFFDFFVAGNFINILAWEPTLPRLLKVTPAVYQHLNDFTGKLTFLY